MGVKNFYYNFREKFKDTITKSVQYEHDVLIIELNGLFYSAVKKIYNFVNSFKYQKLNNDINIKLYQEICDNLYKIIIKYLPKKKIFLVVDGIPGMMKNTEQRQRRFKNSLENKYKGFDLNAFSPGTKLLGHLTKYVDWFLRYQITCDPILHNLEIYFSNEKVVGEGEMKILKFINKELTKNDKILIYNCDSDLILLSIFSEYQITICRNSVLYGEEFINIEMCRNQLINYVKWDKFDKKRLLTDVIILFFLLGNDYINSSPSVFRLDILYDDILPLYKLNKMHFVDKNFVLILPNVCKFFQTISIYEEKWFNKKIKYRNSPFVDDIYEDSITLEKFNFKKYQQLYENTFLKDSSIETYCILYLQTIQNYVNIFTSKGVRWDFFYPYYSTPFLKDFYYTKSMQEKFDIFFRSNDKYTFNCFIHLLIILPPQSKNLLPISLQKVFTDLKEYFPSKLEFNLVGKRNIWESTISNMKPIDLNIFTNYFNSKKNLLCIQETKKIMEGKTFLYNYDIYNREDFDSYYGKITNCPVKCKYIVI